MIFNVAPNHGSPVMCTHTFICNDHQYFRSSLQFSNWLKVLLQYSIIIGHNIFKNLSIEHTQKKPTNLTYTCKLTMLPIMLVPPVKTKPRDAVAPDKAHLPPRNQHLK